jgi:hypothetical protein
MCYASLPYFVLISAAVAGSPTADQARALVPWQHMNEKQRHKLEAIIAEPTVYHCAPSEVFLGSRELYALLLHEPRLTLELWKGLDVTSADMEQVEPGHYRGSDGKGSKGQWEFVYTSPELSVIYAEGEYRGPLLGGSLKTQSVVLLRTIYFQERDGKQYVKHQAMAFVRVDSGSLKLLAKAMRPVLQKSVEATVQESMWFVSLMCRYVHHDPHDVARLVGNAQSVPAEARDQLLKMLEPLQATTPPHEPLPINEP